MNINRMRNPNDKRFKKINIGEIRKNQLITTFGIGSVVDFIKNTAIIGGIDNWDSEDFEDRKIVNESLRAITGADYFIEPKTDINNKYSDPPSDALYAYTFPNKMHCPVCGSLIDAKEMEHGKNSWQCVRYNENNERCKGHPTASRFVVVCEKGHIDDFPYSQWLHEGKPCASGKGAPKIIMKNAAGRSDAESLFLKCTDCSAVKSMSGIFGANALSGKVQCSGRHPHLGNYRNNCDCVPRVMLRSSTSIYFPINYSALIIPPWSQRAIEMIEKRYDELDCMTDEGRTKYFKNKMLPHCSNITVQDLTDAYAIVRSHREKNAAPKLSDIYISEYHVLCRGDVSDDRYRARSVDVPVKFTNYFEKITVIDHLVVTKALAGFTRIKPYEDGDRSRIVPLSRTRKNWLPAVELNGEGIFIKFNENEITKWVEQIADRYVEMTKNYSEAFFKFEKFSPKYVMLHTFAHLLIRQIASECGYSSASIQERIYSDFVEDEDCAAMSGVLIYLSSSDNEGSLGGLVSAAENSGLFEKILTNMLEEARWCSSDPICMLSTHQGFGSLNYAACHACTLLPETSCEFRNLFLDRVSIVGAIDFPELGYLNSIPV